MSIVLRVSAWGNVKERIRGCYEMESNNIHYALRSQRIGEGEHGEQGMEWSEEDRT